MGASVIPDLVVDALAAHRLTRLVTADTILVGPRDAIVRGAYRRRDQRDGTTTTTPNSDDPEPGDWSELAMADDDAPKLATLVTCRWCTGMYVAAGVVAARRVAPRWWAPVADMLAVATGATLVAGLED